jgi:mRNA-degrading endonuclease RelE of RelBE toxin-antitoxin system
MVSAAIRKGFSMAAYQIEMTEDARTDLSYYTAFERKTIVSSIRDQLTHQPLVATRNRKPLRDHPIASWELRVDNFRVFYYPGRKGPHTSPKRQRVNSGAGQPLTRWRFGLVL